MTLAPYLNFDGRCEEAIAYYKSALGAEVDMLMRFKDAPKNPSQGCCEMPPGTENKIMHAALRIGGSLLMASDCHCQNKPEFKGVSLNLTARDDAQAAKIFAALSDGGSVCVPLNKTFFASSFGVVTDRFGVTWMVAVVTM
ncbi:MAG TPA: VOC family protein [Tepidisphaeraceae bacterium]|jgi:PhnB protein